MKRLMFILSIMISTSTFAIQYNSAEHQEATVMTAKENQRRMHDTIGAMQWEQQRQMLMHQMQRTIDSKEEAIEVLRRFGYIQGDFLQLTRPEDGVQIVMEAYDFLLGSL